MRIVKIINSLNPDIVLFAGDLVDEDIEPVIRQNLGETLRQIKSKYGIYGITGNHEYIGGVEPACKYLIEHGVIMLRDSVAKVANAFTLVGREDVSIRQFNGKKRKQLSELMNGVDTTLPVILMDHQGYISRLHAESCHFLANKKCARCRVPVSERACICEDCRIHIDCHLRSYC